MKSSLAKRPYYKCLICGTKKRKHKWSRELLCVCGGVFTLDDYAPTVISGTDAMRRKVEGCFEAGDKRNKPVYHAERKGRKP